MKKRQFKKELKKRMAVREKRDAFRRAIVTQDALALSRVMTDTFGIPFSIPIQSHHEEPSAAEIFKMRTEKSLKKMSSKKLFEYAEERYAAVKKFVEQPNGQRLVMTPELEAFAEKNAVAEREKIRAMAIERQKKEEAEMLEKQKGGRR